MILDDVQNDPTPWPIAIDQVGVTDLRFPICILDRSRSRQQVTADISMSVDLPRQFKGTHMSRFLEILHEHRDGEFTMHTLPAILKSLRTRLEASSAHIELKFPYFLERLAPVTGMAGLMDYDCVFRGAVNGASEDFVMGVKVPVANLCPCSKAISEYGAHNQRGVIGIEIRPRLHANGTWDFIWLEEIIERAEASASSPVYSVLKRPDERHVTMHMFENPAFVEDVVRAVATNLIADDRVSWFHVHMVSFESIHNHNAFARIEWVRPDMEK